MDFQRDQIRNVLQPRIPKSCNSLTLYLSSMLLRKLDANAIVCQTVSEHCSNTAPKQVRDASHFMQKSLCGL